MGNADGVFDVDTEGDSVAGVGFELADLLDGFEYVAAHVFFHQQQNHVALGFQAQAEKGLGDLDPFAAGAGNNGGAGCAFFPGRILISH
jgi:hypothetical protein